MHPFMQHLAADSSLRDAFVSWVDEDIARENSLDRIDATHPFEYQRGTVAAYRRLRERVVALEQGAKS